MRFLVLSLSLLLLVGFSSTANAAPNSGQISGFDAFRGLMDKIVSHWGATHRVSEAKWQKDRQYCNETMSTLMMEADKYKDILATANNTVANWTAKAEKAKQSLAPLEKRLSELVRREGWGVAYIYVFFFTIVHSFSIFAVSLTPFFVSFPLSPLSPTENRACSHPQPDQAW